MNDVIIRSASVEDAEELLSIYGYYIKNTAITFEYDVPTLENFQQRIVNTLKTHPYLILEKSGKILGYTYAGHLIKRAACDHAAEVSIYLARDTVKCGYGRMLYEAMEQEMKKRGFLNLYASIAYPETEDEYLTRNSAQFHEHLGYEKVGEFHKCGYKFGRWYHLIWVEKMIGEHEKSCSAGEITV